MAEITQSASGNHSEARKKRKRLSIRIDMTPMVDLAFLLLTFFVLTRTLHKVHEMRIDMPEEVASKPTPVPANRVITFLLGEHNELYWRQGLEPNLKRTDFSTAGLKKILQDKKVEIPRLVVFIKALAKSNYSNVVDMFDEITLAKITDYSIADITNEDKEMIRAYTKNAVLNTTN